MNEQKNSMEITGKLLLPLTVGESAFIMEAGGTRRTSMVLNVEDISQTEVQFETRNTIYYLHLIPQEVAL